MRKKFRNRIANAHSDSAQEEQMRKQHRFTILVAWSVVCTLVFVIIPFMFVNVFVTYLPKEILPITVTFIHPITNLNPISNFFIFALKAPDMKAAVKKLFRLN